MKSAFQKKLPYLFVDSTITSYTANQVIATIPVISAIVLINSQRLKFLTGVLFLWRGQDSNLRSSGYEPDELSSSPPRYKNGFGFSLFISEKPGINHFLKTCKDCLFNVECCDFLPLHTLKQRL